ncbi:MAG: TlpA family protein disulfide reductase [Campylobacterales bacterium]|nr:TlpA family protein disulfide reductase [Campylobacterales bacterium]
MGKEKLLNGIIIILSILLLAIIGLYLFSSQKTINPTSTAQTDSLNKEFSSEATTFVFKSITDQTFHIHTNGEQFEIPELKNKLVFLKVFGWDCQFCQKEIPELIQLKQDLNESFEVIAIEGQQFSKEESLQFVKEYGINYPVITGSDYPEFYDFLQIAFQWRGEIPLTIVIGKNGTVLTSELGAQSYTLSELLKASLLTEKQAN